MSKRQERWKELGYTDEQIKNHLNFERRKAKLSREIKKKNNLKNKDKIRSIKREVIGKKFANCRLLSINPTVDGKGFWLKVHKTFLDGSEGIFREFWYFDDFNLKEFINTLR